MATLLEHLARWRPFNVLVVGDFMMDQLVFGDAERLSRDAPVPVLQVRRTEEQPGGAGNVCLDLAALRGKVRAFGVVGDDNEGQVLRQSLNHAGVTTQGLIVDADRPTTVKRSLVGLAQHRHAQKMFRLDMESRRPLAAHLIDQLLNRFDQALAEADVVCIEDHGNGVCCGSMCPAIIERCRRAGKPVLVDPALIDDYSRYRGATAISPNRTEAEFAAHRLAAPPADDPDANGRRHALLATRLLESLNVDAVVLTLDRDGALLCERNAEPAHLPTVAKQVYDVTGAGDMVIAALTAARANGVDWPDAVRFSNAAAGLEVEVFGVRPIPLERVHHAVLVQGRRLRGKTRTLEEAMIEVAAHRREGRSIVFTNGCFDLLHAGHIWTLREASKFGDVLIVGLNDDDSIRRIKGLDRPVNNQADRLEILGELESVDAVVLFSENTPRRLIEALMPDVLVKGADYTREQIPEAELVESWGGRLELVPLLEGRSTTLAIERMRGA